MAQMTATQSGSISLEHLLDEHVRDMQGEDIGKVDDLILDAGSGTIDFAIVRFGGFLGMGGKYHLIPWPMLKVDLEQRNFTMDVSKEKVEQAPSFDRGNVPRTDDTEYLDSVYQYWGVDRTMQHQRMTDVQYGEQRASVGAGATSGQSSGGQMSSDQSTGGQMSSEYTGMGASSGGAQAGGYSGPERRSMQSAGYSGQDRRMSAQSSMSSGMSGGQQMGASGSSQRDVSYGAGMFGPERRNVGIHDTGWTGTERRAGW